MDMIRKIKSRHMPWKLFTRMTENFTTMLQNFDIENQNKKKHEKHLDIPHKRLKHFFTVMNQ